MPPIADHDIVYIECITSLRRCQPNPRKIFKYSKANWENINKELGKLEKEIKDKYADSDVNTIWNLLKNEIHRSVTENIPQKMLKHRKNLPWITNEIKTKMSKYKKNYKKYKLSGKCKDSNLEQMKANIQKEQRTAYWQYIEKMICNIPVDDDKTGKIPNDWRYASVCPAFKKGDTNNPINYRPVSLTCIICKLLEHVVTSSIMKHLEYNNILYDLQHGFRSFRSCETQLVSFIQDLAKSSDKNIQTDLIIMDFAKAFDKVSHKHLMYKISYYGINCNAFHWIKDFLTDRTQTVILEGETSNKTPVTSGVPQGTVLGPILFLIFINDLAEYIQHSTLRLFADDSIIYKQIKNKEDAIKLQQDLDAAGKWEQDWLMHFHPDKCTVVSVAQKRKTISHTYQLHGHTLEKDESAKYLGITIQNNLKWDKHINTITAKANQSLGFIKRNLKVHSPAIKEHAFKALVRPKLEYCNTMWDPHNSKNFKLKKFNREQPAMSVTGTTIQAL